MKNKETPCSTNIYIQNHKYLFLASSSISQQRHVNERFLPSITTNVVLPTKVTILHRLATISLFSICTLCLNLSTILVLLFHMQVHPYSTIFVLFPYNYTKPCAIVYTNIFVEHTPYSSQSL